MRKVKDKFITAINLWLVPFLIGGWIAIGFKITQQTLIRIESTSKSQLRFLKKEIVPTEKQVKALI